MGEMVVVREFPQIVVQVMNNNVFFWVSTTSSRFEIVLNHPTCQAFISRQKGILKIILVAICIMAHCIAVTIFAKE